MRSSLDNVVERLKAQSQEMASELEAAGMAAIERIRVKHLKTHHGFERLRLRGLSGARDEFHLAAIVQNLKTLALRLIRPPPQSACA